jgi:hypothetical protein
MSQII